MPPGFDRDFDWQRQFLPRVKQLIANYLITEAAPEEDKEHNTDLLVLKATTMRIACRIRKSGDLKYEGEFTIRSKRPSGAKTELAKVIEGWGDYIFYGFEHPSDPFALSAWLLGDLNVFRLWHSYQLIRRKGELPGLERENPDGSSWFRAYGITSLPSSFVVARKSPDRQPLERA
jgi:hypothetical protein